MSIDSAPGGNAPLPFAPMPQPLISPLPPPHLVASQVPCLECGEPQVHTLHDHLSNQHGLTIRQYLAKHPSAATVSPRLAAKVAHHVDPNRPRKAVRGSPVLSLAGVQFPVDLRVPQSACLPAPENYVLPETGSSKLPVLHILTALRKRRPTWIHGPTGAGKDAIVHFVSAACRIPALFVEFRPNADAEAMITSRGFKNGSTVWEEGEVLRAIVEGYKVKNEAGEVVARVPYLILLSDIDRATPEQLEILRPVLDSISGRVPLPNGEVREVLRGTQFVATANTVGTGERTVDFVTAQAQDVSMLNRFECFFQLDYPEWNITAEALRRQFAPLLSLNAELLDRLGEFVKALRNDRGRVIRTPFSHRDCVACLNHLCDLIEVAGWTTKPGDKTFIFAGLRSWFHRLPPDAISIALGLATTHMKNVDVPKTIEAFP